jgi:P-type Cu+ transporter
MPDVKESLPTNAIIPPIAESVATAHGAEPHEAHDHGFELQDGIRIVLAAVAASLVWFRVWEPFAHVSIIGIAGTLIGIYPILKEAAENVMERRMTMELSMTIAIFAALAIGQFFTALIIGISLYRKSAN